MNDEIKHKIKAILSEAQVKVDQLASGLRVTALVLERTETNIQSDVSQALQDRQSAGIGARHVDEAVAPSTLESASQQERDLIERALQESRAVDLEK